MIQVYQTKIATFYRQHRRMPSYAEIMKLVGVKSKNTVSYFITRLIDQGVITKDKKGKLIPKHLFGNVKVLGTVEAGFPGPVEEETVDTMTIDEYLIENKEATFMLKVNGDSMKDAGIMPGDMVLVQRNLTPHDGDIVIAEIDSNWTMKYFRKSNGVIFLQPANQKYKNIYPAEELKIGAVVRAVIRKY